MKPLDLAAEIKPYQDKIASLRTELEEKDDELINIRAWSLACFGTTHPEMRHDPKPTYTELESKLQEVNRVVGTLVKALEEIGIVHPRTNCKCDSFHKCKPHIAIDALASFKNFREGKKDE